MPNPLIETKGRVRQKVATLAKLAGIPLPKVAFTRKEVEQLLGVPIPWRRSMFTKKDTSYARAISPSSEHPAIVWVKLPISDSTLAHEVTHFITKLSHYSNSFAAKAVALKRGKVPSKAAWRTYEVRATTVETWHVIELTADAAKKSYHRGKLVKREQKAQARRL